MKREPLPNGRPPWLDDMLPKIADVAGVTSLSKSLNKSLQESIGFNVAARTAMQTSAKDAVGNLNLVAGVSPSVTRQIAGFGSASALARMASEAHVVNAQARSALLAYATGMSPSASRMLRQARQDAMKAQTALATQALAAVGGPVSATARAAMARAFVPVMPAWDQAVRDAQAATAEAARRMSPPRTADLYFATLGSSTAVGLADTSLPVESVPEGASTNGLQYLLDCLSTSLPAQWWAWARENPQLALTVLGLVVAIYSATLATVVALKADPPPPAPAPVIVQPPDVHVHVHGDGAVTDEKPPSR